MKGKDSGHPALKFVKILVAGILFGIVFTTIYASSWVELKETIHQYPRLLPGLLLAMIGLGVLLYQFVKYLGSTSVKEIAEKIPFKKFVLFFLLGGVLFGAGWSLVAHSSHPIYKSFTNGAIVLLVVLLGGFLGILARKFLK